MCLASCSPTPAQADVSPEGSRIAGTVERRNLKQASNQRTMNSADQAPSDPGHRDQEVTNTPSRCICNELTSPGQVINPASCILTDIIRTDWAKGHDLLATQLLASLQ